MNNAQVTATVKTTAPRRMPLGSKEFNVAARPVVTFSGAQQNELLAALPREVLESLFEHLELVTLPFGKELFEFGGAMEYVTFPTTAIVSLLYVMEDGATTEIAVVGHEGVVGVSLFEGERAMCSAVVQAAGYGYRMKAQHLRDAFNQGGALPALRRRPSRRCRPPSAKCSAACYIHQQTVIFRLRHLIALTRIRLQA